MTKEHAELIAKKEQERRVDIANLTSHPEYYVFVEEIEKIIDSLDKISELDFESNSSVEVQALANKLARNKILKFLADMKAYSNNTKYTIDKSYD